MFNPTIYSKIKSKVKLTKEGTELKITFKTYDKETGEEFPEIKESLVITVLEAQKALLQAQIASIDELIKDLQKL